MRGSHAVYFVVGVFGLLALLVGGLGWVTGGVVRPAIYIVFAAGVIVAVLTIFARMITVVDAAGVHVRYVPFLRKTFSLDDIIACREKTYDPMEYGGWGVRGWPSRYGWAYNVRGNRGVEIEFANGNRLMLGSQRTESLAAAIREAKGTAP